MRLFLASGRLFAARFMDDTFCIVNVSANRCQCAIVPKLLCRLLFMYEMRA